MHRANSHLLHYQPSPDGPLLSAGTMIEAIRQTRPKLVSLPNPNSPTGTFHQQNLRYC